MSPLALFHNILAEFSTASLGAQLLAKATLLLAVAWIVHFSLARANPRWRTLLWRGTAASLLLTAVWALGLPLAEIRVPPPEPVATVPAVSPQAARSAPELRDGPPFLHRAEVPDSTQRQSTPRQDPIATRPLETWWPWPWWPAALVSVWGLGAALLAVRLAAGYVRLARLLRTSRAVPTEIAAQVERIAAAVGCRRAVQVRSSGQFAVPFLVGLRRPLLLLPERMCQPAYRGQLPGILAHELAHATGWDCAWNAALQSASVLLWFHPLAWRIGSAHRAACDAVCDAVSASYLGDVEAYCRTLARVALECAAPVPAAGLAMARTCDVRRRIAALQRRVSAAALGRRAAALAMLAGALLSVLLAGIRLARAEPPRPGESPAVAASSLPTAKPSAGPPPILLSASGTVVDETGKPLAGAAVYLRESSLLSRNRDVYDERPQDVLASTQTDPQGVFRFESVPARPFFWEDWEKQNPWEVVAVAKGRAMGWQPFKARRRDKIVLTLGQEAKITGRAVDRAGRPVADVEVQVQEIASLSAPDFGDFFTSGLFLQWSRLAPTAKTDKDGRFAIGGLPADVLLGVALDHEQYRTADVCVATSDKPQADRDFGDKKPRKLYSRSCSVVLAPRGPNITGRVLFADTGKPYAGARVVAIWQLQAITAVADDAGRFVIRNTGRSELQKISFPPGDKPNLNCLGRFDFAAEPQFLVTDSPSPPACHVAVGPPEQGDYVGRCTFVKLPQDGKDVDIDLTLPRGAVLAGEVVDEDSGKGIPGVKLRDDREHWWEDVDFLFCDGAMTDRKGGFRMVVPAGQARIVLLGPVEGYYAPFDRLGGLITDVNEFGSRQTGDAPAERDPGPITDPRFLHTAEMPPKDPAARLRFTLGGGLIIGGRVVDPEGKPVAGADVNNEPGSSGSTHVRTDAEGRFVLAGFAPQGEQSLLVVEPGRKLIGCGIVPAKPQAGAKRSVAIEVALQPAITITGRALDGRQPIAGAGVMLMELHRGPADTTAIASESQAQTGADGRYEFALQRSDAEYAVMGYAEGFVWEPFDVRYRVPPGKPGQTVEAPPIELLRCAAPIAGIVVDPQGNPVAGVEVDATVRHPNWGDSHYEIRSQTDKDGCFRLDGFPDAPLEVEARLPGDGDRYLPARVDAKPGQTDLRIVLNRKPAVDKK
jgi:beta-lactamase regulating signal transducer with metallopeptidase domain/protocatechuate 3,4-dioxygenase beta subunit